MAKRPNYLCLTCHRTFETHYEWMVHAQKCVLVHRLHAAMEEMRHAVIKHIGEGRQMTRPRNES